jgi:membrane associated rhomboid family serine protease
MLFPLFVLNPHRRFPLMTLILIAANIIVTVRMMPMSELARSRLASTYGFIPARFSRVDSGKDFVARVIVEDPVNLRVKVRLVRLSTKAADVCLTLLTTMFLHAGWLHVLMNMWMFWVFGGSVEERLGSCLFLVFYLFCGIIGTLVLWATNPHSMVPVVGASGAVAAVLGGYAVSFPTAKVRTLVFFLFIVVIDLPALILLGVWFGLQLFNGVLGLQGIMVAPVAFWSHIGGFVAGMIGMPLLSRAVAPTKQVTPEHSPNPFSFDDPRFGGRE